MKNFFLLLAIFTFIFPQGCSSHLDDDDPPSVDEEDVHSHGDEESSTPRGVCSTSCEKNLWPALILGFVDLRDEPGEPPAATVQLQRGERIFDGIESGCPDLPPQYDCWYSFSLGDTGEPWTLSVSLDEEVFQTQIDHSRLEKECAEAIGYVTLTREETEYSLSSARVIKPCNETINLPIP